MIDLEGRVAVVTGASSGIGRAIALRLASAGVRLCLLGRDPAALEQTARDTAPTAAPVRLYAADLLDDAAVERTARRIIEDFGAIDVLVHAAGVYCAGSVAELPVGDFDRLWRTNVRAPYLLTQVLLPALRRPPGQVVFVNSSAGLSAGPHVAAYAATKHALRALADGLRAEVNPEGVRVVSVYPGRTSTPMQHRILELEGRVAAPDELLRPETVAEVVVQALRVDATGEVTDVHVRPVKRLSG
jgi:NAD(P)-dependent dehydrogenase (short-subunit alcohol dehydrogenase family)